MQSPDADDLMLQTFDKIVLNSTAKDKVVLVDFYAE